MSGTGDLLSSFADVALAENDKNDDENPCPPRKRLKLEQAPLGGKELVPKEGQVAPYAEPIQPSESEEELASNARVLSGDTETSFPPKPAQKSARIQIRPSLSNYPRSLYEGWNPPLPPTPEHIALNQLLACSKSPLYGLY